MTVPVSLDDVKADLNIAGSESDAFLTRAIASTWAAIENYTGRKLTQATVRDTYAAVKGSVLLSRFPANSITSVVVDGTALDPSEYVVRPSGHVQRLSNGAPLPWVASSLAVTYSAGYTSATLPADLYRVVLSCVGDAYAAKQAGQFLPGVSGDVRRASIEGVGSIELSSTAAFGYYTGKSHALLGPWTQLLDGYRDLGEIPYLVKSEEL